MQHGYNENSIGTWAESPEPATFLLMTSGMLALASLARKRKVLGARCNGGPLPRMGVTQQIRDYIYPTLAPPPKQGLTRGRSGLFLVEPPAA